MKMNRTRKGFTLTELAIVLGVVGLILGSIWVAAKSVFDANKSKQAIEDISAIAANLRATYMAASSFGATTGDQTTTLMNLGGIFPSNLLVGNPATAVKNQWNGSVKVIFNPSGNARVFRISYLNTNEDACFRIASQLANLGTADAPINLITNTNNVVAISNTGANVGLATSAVQTACLLNKGSSSASTEFDYTIH